MRSVLITGGTGSFGSAFVRRLLSRADIERVVVYSRDELKQHELRQQNDDPRLRCFLGDVRDAERLRRACDGVDTIVHAAALKQVPAIEYNPMEAIKTNVLGATNVVAAALDTDVRCVVALSTDKAASPVNLYGATKLCAEKLFTAATDSVGRRDLRFTCVRYGNVLGSRGSVVPAFLAQRSRGWLPITHEAMTRFSIVMPEAIDLVLYAYQAAEGGEVFIPKLPSYRLVDLAAAVAPDCELRTVGVRPGEKLHEELISESESRCVTDARSVFVLRRNGTVGAPPWRYASDTNPELLSVEALRRQIREFVDPTFEAAA